MSLHGSPEFIPPKQHWLEGDGLLICRIPQGFLLNSETNALKRADFYEEKRTNALTG